MVIKVDGALFILAAFAPFQNRGDGFVGGKIDGGFEIFTVRLYVKVLNDGGNGHVDGGRRDVI